MNDKIIEQIKKIEKGLWEIFSLMNGINEIVQLREKYLTLLKYCYGDECEVVATAETLIKNNKEVLEFLYTSLFNKHKHYKNDILTLLEDDNIRNALDFKPIKSFLHSYFVGNDEEDVNQSIIEQEKLFYNREKRIKTSKMYGCDILNYQVSQWRNIDKDFEVYLFLIKLLKDKGGLKTPYFEKYEKYLIVDSYKNFLYIAEIILKKLGKIKDENVISDKDDETQKGGIKTIIN